MSKKILSVIDTAYRAVQEEQDDAGLWFSAAVRNSGLNVDILLTGNGVNYAVLGHPTEPFDCGGHKIEHPFNPTSDIQRLIEKGARCHIIREDIEERGIDPKKLITSVEQITRQKMADFISQYDSIWHW